MERSVAKGAIARILNVDDSVERLYVKSKILQRAGYETLEARSGGAALDALTQEHADLVLLDVLLPDMDGFEVCRRIKEDVRTREVPVLHISALRTADLDEANGLESGADYYLCEPVQEEALLAVIKTLLMRAQWQREREELLQKAEAARLEAEQANKAKDKFLSVLSHELRDPLHILSSWLTILKKGGVDAAVVQRAYDTMERNVRAQTRLVEELLDVARIESGKMLFKRAKIAIDAILRAALDDVRPAADAKGVRLSYSSAAAKSTIMGDSHRIGQVVRNLLNNAVKFTARGGDVTVDCREHDGQIGISVTDTGVGIAAEVLPHVFEPYYQGGEGTQRGLGLGLAIAAYIVGEHNGTIDVRSDGTGKGSTFVVTLPLAPPSSAMM